MQIEQSILKSEEQILLRLRELYRRYGYSCFKMSKFEEYDLYSRHKNFLVSDHVITFNDVNGKLMALKPDVTLSIVKNYRGGEGGVSRLYYNENVYRVSPRTHGFQEIMQTGLECLGQLTAYHICEVVSLACMSLSAVSEKSVLNISHMGVLSALLERVDLGEEREELLRCVEEKNGDGVKEICRRRQVPERDGELLFYLATAAGSSRELLDRADEMAGAGAVREAVGELRTVVEQVSAMSPVPVQVDFSLVSDMRYYNGIVFQGYVAGVPTGVLRGGQYDQLMEQMGQQASAVGFAVYLDQLERLIPPADYDVDVLLLYDGQDDLQAVCSRAAELIAEGNTVSVQTQRPEKLTCRRVEYVREGGVDHE